MGHLQRSENIEERVLKDEKRLVKQKSGRKSLHMYKKEYGVFWRQV